MQGSVPPCWPSQLMTEEGSHAVQLSGQRKKKRGIQPQGSPRRPPPSRVFLVTWEEEEPLPQCAWAGLRLDRQNKNSSDVLPPGLSSEDPTRPQATVFPEARHLELSGLFSHSFGTPPDLQGSGWGLESQGESSPRPLAAASWLAQ